MKRVLVSVQLQGLFKNGSRNFYSNNKIDGIPFYIFTLKPDAHCRILARFKHVRLEPGCTLTSFREFELWFNGRPKCLLAADFYQAVL